ncbi:MAG: polynucleotide adenylyltransferase PcnB [Sphaerochaetaceae bacterium]
MLIRYKKESDGSRTPLAHIYNASEHGIKSTWIDLDALWVIRKLKQAGAQAYIVGGAVRDLILQKQPKDFDICTSMTPRQVQRLFYNGRVIGRRFKLVHLTFKDKIIEVSTFRSGVEQPSAGATIYGSIDQDAKRRDFTINALYYDPTDGQLIDFNGGMEDLKKGRIRSVMPLPDSFIEDPVRMIRAIKYAVSTQFFLQNNIKRAIRKNAHQLARISSSRLTEEVMKILASGNAKATIQQLQRYKLLVHLLPCISVSTKMPEIYASLATLDQSLEIHKKSKEGIPESMKAVMLGSLVAPLLPIDRTKEPADLFSESYAFTKELISPITPPNYDVQKAVEYILNSQNIEVPPQSLRFNRPAGPSAAMGYRTRQRRPQQPTPTFRRKGKKRTST